MAGLGTEKYSKMECVYTVLLFAIGLWFITLGIAEESLWADEAFSAAMISHSFADILDFSTIEFHSQLYYWSLKLFSLVFGTSELSLRMFSVLGTVSLALLGPTAVRRLYTKSAGWFFSIVIFITPALVSYSQEARMYTWAAFFGAAMALYAFLYLYYQKRRDLVLFAIFLAGAMYIHVMTLVGAFFFNLIFLGLILYRGNRTVLKEYIVAVSVPVLLFAPRILVLIEQSRSVQENFWIQPVSFGRILASLYAPFSIKFWDPMLPGFLFYLVVGIALIYIVSSVKDKDRDALIPAVLLAAYACTFIFIVVYSILLKPILEPRYLVVFAPWLVFGFTVLPEKTHIRFGMFLVSFFFLCSITINVHTWMHRYNGPMFKIKDELSQRLTEDDVFLHIDELTLGTFTYYFPDHKHFFLHDDRSEVYWHLPVFREYGKEGDDIDELVGQYDSVYVIDRQYGFNTDKFNSEFNTLGTITYEETFYDDRAWYKPIVVQYVRTEEDTTE